MVYTCHRICEQNNKGVIMLWCCYLFFFLCVCLHIQLLSGCFEIETVETNSPDPLDDSLSITVGFDTRSRNEPNLAHTPKG